MRNIRKGTRKEKEIWLKASGAIIGPMTLAARGQKIDDVWVNNYLNNYYYDTKEALYPDEGVTQTKNKRLGLLSSLITF